MPCHIEENVRGLGTVIWCGPGPRKRRCAHCGSRDAKALCDWPMGNGKTCDKPCCYRCRRSPDTNVHYCLDHWSAEARTPEPARVEPRRAEATQARLFDA